MDFVKQAKKALDSFPLHVYPPVYTPPDPNATPELWVFPTRSSAPVVRGDGFVSLDVECIKYQALAAFSNYSCQIQPTFHFDAAPNGRLPFLVTPTGQILGGRDIEREIKKQAGDIDRRLSPSELGDCRTYASLVEAKITLALMYSLWMEEDHLNQVTKPVHSSFYPTSITLPVVGALPILGNWVSSSIRNRMTTWIQSRRPGLRTDELYEEARVALAALSTRLGSSLYFFGTKPTTLDTVVFASLHIILSIKTPKDELFIAVQKHDNLVQYTRRVWNTFFVPSDRPTVR
ncbi:hypothetical protein SmJEL517_g02828 [Synchytrium microbalum]|uniref:Metaxin glutathione S-transferase domain-containing protein n=1 Tax=Synchytrium microbalum TaxID=1806994 RepID=A0A507C937_9FUNG|nr:uncharacterized protein SmJEL517_g02828 [Synchytrium microbalum]TPX34484.1 hypothetical protein SmJEL517_g02828 [Synchytrium microbalum]